MATAVASAMKEAQSFWEKAISSSPSKGSSGRGSEGERYGSEDNHDEAAMKIQQEQRARLHCVSLLLDWNGLEIDGVSERPAVNAVDDHEDCLLDGNGAHRAGRHPRGEVDPGRLSASLVHSTFESLVGACGAHGHGW